MEVGRISARLDAVFDDRGFDLFDRRLNKAKQEADRKIEAKLTADAELREFDRYIDKLDKAKAETRKKIEANLEANPNYANDLRRYERELDKARADTKKKIQANLDAKVDTSGFSKFNRESREASIQADRAEKKTKGFGGALGGIGGKAGAALGAAGGIYGLGRAVQFVTDAYGESQRVQAQTNAVLKSTGGAAGVTSKQVGDLAGSLSKMSGVDDEAVQSGENLLLTFTNVQNKAGAGNDIFNQASSAMLDMATAMGTDSKSAALQLGKALNDPEKGMTRLQKVGVTFTDAQKKQVAAMQASGDMAGAQRVILAELNKEFGGSAKAAGDTMPGAFNKLKVAAGNVAESIGGKLAPFLTKAANALTALISGSGKGSKELGGFGRAVKSVVGFVGDFGRGVSQVFTKNRDVLAQLGAAWGKVFGTVGKFVREIGKSVKDVFGGESTKGMGKDFQTIGRALIQLQTIFAKFYGFVVKLILPAVAGAFRGLLFAIRGVVKIISGILSGDFSKVWSGLKDLVRGAVGVITSTFLRIPIALLKLVPTVAKNAAKVGKAFVGAIMDFVRDFPRNFYNGLLKTIVFVGRFERTMISNAASIGSKFVKKLIDFIEKLPSRAWTTFKATISRVGDFERDLIKSAADMGTRFVSKLISKDGLGNAPSELFKLGGKMVTGLANALKNLPGQIITGIGSSANFAKSIYNGLAKMINDKTPFGDRIDLPTPLPTINLPRMPYLARGGKVNKMTAYITGEEAPTFPEFVVSTNPRDRSRMQAMLPDILSSLGVNVRAFSGGGYTDKQLGAATKFPSNRLTKQVAGIKIVSADNVKDKWTTIAQRKYDDVDYWASQMDSDPGSVVKEGPDGIPYIDQKMVKVRLSNLTSMIENMASGKVKGISEGDSDSVLNTYLRWIDEANMRKGQMTKFRQILNAAIKAIKIPRIQGKPRTNGPGAKAWLRAVALKKKYEDLRTGVRAEEKAFGGVPGFVKSHPMKEATNDLNAMIAEFTTLSKNPTSFIPPPDGSGDVGGDPGGDPGEGGDAPGDAPDSGGEDVVAPPTVEEIATAAAEQVRAMNAGRADLFSGFGSNVASSAGGLGGALDDASEQAAGTRFFGAFGDAGSGDAGMVHSGGGSGFAAGGGGVTVVNNFKEQPPDPLTWSKGIDFELRAAI